MINNILGIVIETQRITMEFDTANIRNNKNVYLYDLMIFINLNIILD